MDPKAVERTQRILRERSEPPKKKPPTPATGFTNPYDLKPIHLRSEPLPQLSEEDQLFCKKSGASNIVRERAQSLKKFKPSFSEQEPGPLPPRRSNRFVDDSAIESDGEGGDIPSSATTPRPSRSPSPVRVRSVQKSIIKANKPKCSICNLSFSGPMQEAIHLKSKKHLKQARNSSGLCITCEHFFTSQHNLRYHKCSKFLKNETFYKLN